MIRLFGLDGTQLDLLMIPPDTATVLAAACLAMVARQEGAPHPGAGPTTVRAPISLPVIPLPRRDDGEQVSRWETDGGDSR